MKFFDFKKREKENNQEPIAKERPPIKKKKVLSPRIVFGLLIAVALGAALYFQSDLKAFIPNIKGPAKEYLSKIPVVKDYFSKETEVEDEVIRDEELPQEAILVKVYKVEKRDFEDALPLMGTMTGFKEIKLRFEINGVIDSFNFEEGERVERGEIIATLDQKDALLKLKYNEIELQKHQKLFDIGAIIKSKLEQVTLELESAKRELDKTYLYAPRGGVIGAKDVEIGEFITSNDKVATLIDDNKVFAEVGIIEKDIGKVKLGQVAQVVVDTYPDTKFNGVVDNISPVIEGKSRTQTAKIKIKNPKARLIPGMFARASCAVYNAKNVVVIPNTALDKTDEGYMSYVVKKPEGQQSGSFEEEDEDIEEEGIAEARSINADYRSAEFFVVKAGLEEGDLVVVETQEKLKDGARVVITEVQEVIF